MKHSIVLVLFVVLFPSLCVCQEEEKTEESQSQPEEFRLSAAAWCKVTDGKKQDEREMDNDSDNDVEGEEENSDSDSSISGCDAGLGFSLYRFNRAHIVGVIGTQSLGTGIAWVLSPETSKRVIAIAIGVIFPFDTKGVYAGDYSLAIGTTISLDSRD